ncbi:MAG: methionine gamma-lyase family protein [Bacillota bacterium]|nr:methionine gamma-lyase family protein [Bacillota bacterium]
MNKQKIIENARRDMDKYLRVAAPVAESNLRRVLEAFRAERVSAQHFQPSTGYGYNDAGRDKLEALYARYFGAEAALVRQQIASGSHAICCALAGNLLPQDELLCLGMPYDTLQTVIGIKSIGAGSLREQGVSCRVLDIDFAKPDAALIASQIRPETKIVAIQRSCGYTDRPALSVAQIGELCAAIHAASPSVIVFVDNCYGEMVEEREPSHVGADLLAGSLIKNIGAGIAPAGGYIAGREELVERAAYRLTIPGGGRELGATLSDNRNFYQALFLAPQIVLEAQLGAVFVASVFAQLGYRVHPAADAPRSDIVQTVYLGDAELLKAFCRGIQKYSPLDSFVSPEPWPMPGYANDIIMAAGGFIAGSSIELSADAPLREPYAVYIQGGLSRYHVIYAVENTLRDLNML